MILRYAATFQQSLDRLTLAEQKQVKITTVDLMFDPSGNGLQLHRIQKTDGFWTARASQDIRIVLYKAGDETLLCWVDHHDAAYRWAERRTLVPHERTGAMQFVEVTERTEERLVYTEKVEARPVPVKRPFAALTDDQLLDVGVPRAWLDPVADRSFRPVRLTAFGGSSRLSVRMGGLAIADCRRRGDDPKAAAQAAAPPSRKRAPIQTMMRGRNYAGICLATSFVRL